MQAILSILSVLLMAIYAFLTYRMLHANQKQITASIRPYVYFEIQLAGGSAEAFLKNTGRTAAYNVKITVKPKLHATVRGAARQPCLTSGTLPLLSPDCEIREYLESFHELNQRVSEPVFTGTIEYDDAEENHYCEAFRLDLTILKDLVRIAHPDVGEELKKIGDRLSEIKRSIDTMGKSHSPQHHRPT